MKWIESNTNKFFFDSSREFKRVLKSPGPYEMDEVDASEVTIEMLQKYDTDHDKYFSYKGKDKIHNFIAKSVNRKHLVFLQ